MSIKAYDAAPYNDDFNISSLEGKNYLRILFKPGFSVQVRELNQMQSTLQSQIDKFGRSIYKEGPVLDGTTYFSDNTDFVDIEMSTSSLNNNMNLILGNTIRVTASGNTSLSAEIFDYKLLSTSGNQTWRFYIRYNSSGASLLDSPATITNTSTFSSTGSPSISVDTSIVITSTNVTIGVGDAIGNIVKTGYAGTITYDKGVFFARGSFIYNDTTQYLHIEKPTDEFNITGKAVFQLVESTVTASDDNQLYDNAQGTPNHQAPGADRYAITLVPKFITTQSELTSIANNASILGTTASSTVNYLELLDVSVSEYVAPARTEYSQLDNTLAVRTSEESGDYTVNPFKVSVREHLNDAADNGGRYLSSDTPAGDDSKFITTIEPSVAYVQGYRAPLEETLEITVDKARTTLATSETVFGSAEIGNYIEGSAIEELPDFNNPSKTYTFTNNTGGALSSVVTCRIRAIEKVGTVFRAYIYDLSGDIPLDARKLIGDNAEGTTDAFEFTLSDDNTSAPTPIYDTSANTSFISLPYHTISDIDKSVSVSESDSEVIIRAIETELTPDVNNKIQLTVNSMTNKSYGRFFNDSLSSYIIIREDTGAVVNATAIEFNPNGGTDNKTIKLTVGISADCTVIAPIKMSLSTSANGIQRKTKTVATATAELVSNDVDSQISKNAIFNLANYDVIKILSVTDGANNPINMDNIELDTGQRDGLYKLGRVKYIGPGRLAGQTPAVGGLKVTYEYYTHGAGDYFDVTSYPSFSDSGYADIPQYKGVYLSDVLDFRPKDNATSAFTLDPNSPTKIKLNYYLGRMDKVIVNTLGDFSVISGEPSIEPSPPLMPVNALALYDVFVPAYTRDIEDIQLRYIDNRRFTMKDIGRLEKRIENLEYYTSLSLLEREANGKQILDSNGDRFKNGIIVDSFQTQGVADVLDPGLQVSFDTDQGELRPLYTLDNIRLRLSGKDGNDQDQARVPAGARSLITLPYTSVPLIEQDTATIDISVNPYDLATWNGTIELSPSSDEWIEVNRRPDVVMNLEGGLDAVASLLNSSNAFRTRWNWRSHTIGRSLGRSRKILFPRTDRGKNFSELAAKRAAGFTGWRPVRQTVETFQTTTVRTGIRQQAKVNKVERNIGDRVVDVSFIPFIRSRRVYFKAQLLKPNTRVYAFFDGVDVSQFCTKGTFVEHSENTTVDTSTFNSTNPLTTLGITRTELVTDDQGDLEGFFVIPNNNTYKFRTGTRKFKLTDSSTNDLANTTTSAEKMYTASGLLQSKESQIVSTQEIEIERTRVTRRINRRITKVVPGSTQYYDPLAQSFIIGNIPTGTFATKIDLYFKAKSSNVPLSVHLVTVENGIPTQKIVPLSKVVKRPADVNISDNATAVTTFEFSSPVYLTPGVEYAIVVMSNSPDYRLWLSEVGGNDVTTGSRVSKNTYAGVSFKSQNASTWTPDQNKDFKMKIYRADFSSTGPGNSYTYRLDPLIAPSQSFDFSTLSLLSEEMNFPETESTYTLRLAGNTEYLLNPDDDTYFDDVLTIDGAPTGNNAPQNQQGAINLELKSTSSYVSPVVDLNRLSLVAADNIITNKATVQPSDAASDTELLAGHGDATARYITREVELNNAADQLNIIMLANKPADTTEIRVYVRVKSSDERLRDVAFTKVEPTSPILIDSGNNFGEVEYTFQNNEPFTSFQVKVVFTSESTARAPRIKDFRAIATI